MKKVKAATDKKFTKSLVWMRRDLRLDDHHALARACEQSQECYLLFIFDKATLSVLKDKKDSRISFIIESLMEIHENINIMYGNPLECISTFMKEHDIEALFFNEDYTPYACKRDKEVCDYLSSINIPVFLYKDCVVFSPNEVLKEDRTPYKVYTPYSKLWLSLYAQPGPHQTTHFVDKKSIITSLKKLSESDIYHLIGFEKTLPYFRGGRKEGLEKIKEFSKIVHDYDKVRDFPYLDKTSHLSVYIRHGIISIREMMVLSSKNFVWLNELIWREFYYSILFFYPNVQFSSFKQKYDSIVWVGVESHFELWCQGQTGFPIVDAAMRCLNKTGFMPNRLRMVVASFLCKTLLIDWKKGERYFAQKLLDYDLASNNGGWQWCSSSGCDAQPYFRIFNPFNQSAKFDPDGIFIKKYIPELELLSVKEIHQPSNENRKKYKYPQEIVDYRINRSAALLMYSSIS